MPTVQEVIKDAYRELQLIDPIDSLPAEMASFGLSKLNRFLDLWNAERRAVYADRLDTFTTQANLSPHTIGASGATWTLSQRPVSIEDATLIDGSTYIPIDIKDADWYTALPAPTTTSTIPIALWYNPGWANGSIYFYPVPSAAKSVRLRTRVQLNAALVLTDTFTFPHGYQEAITLTLAEKLASAYAVPILPDLKDEARKARAIVFGVNDPTPSLTTDVPSGASGGAHQRTHNWLIGPFK